MLLTLVSAPWFFGGIATHVQLALDTALVSALAIWIAISFCQILLGKFSANRLPVLFIPLCASLALGAYQLVERQKPSADSIQHAIEQSLTLSTDEQVRLNLAKDATIRALQTGETVSPAATRFELVRLVMVLTAFFLGTQLFATSRTQLWLWGVLGLNGAALAFFGICQRLSWNGSLFWTFPLKRGGTPFSAFVNRNNAAGYLCICLAASLGLLAWSFTKWVPPRPDGDAVIGLRRRRQQSFGAMISEFVLDLNAKKLFACTLVVLSVTGILAATSRGGWAALFVAGVVTCLFATKSRRIASLGLVLGLALLSAGIVTWSGLGHRISQRWDQIVSIDTIANDSRWDHWRDAFRVVRDFPATGTGFGTYQYAYLPYQSHPQLAHLRFYNADNQFIEWLVEGGFVGLGLVMCVLALFVRTTSVLLKHSQFDARETSGVVSVFLIVSQCVSAAFDFGPTMPANMLALATLFGSLSGRAASLFGESAVGARIRGSTLQALHPKLLAPVLAIGLLVAGGFGLRELNAAAKVHLVSRNLPVFNSPEAMELDKVTESIDRLSAAMTDYADDPDAQHALANLYVYRFRLQEFRRAMAARPNANPEEVWNLTSPAAFYRQANNWQRTDQLERLEMLLDIDGLKTNLVPALEHLIKAQAACQLMPDIDATMATLAFVGDAEHPTGEAHLRRALVIAPVSAEAFYEVGELALLADLDDFSYACLRRSLELSPKYLMPIHRSIVGRLTLVEEIDKVLPESAELLIQLAQSYSAEDDQSGRQFFANRVIDVLAHPAEGAGEAQRRHQLGKARLLLGEVDQAIVEYRRALHISPDEIDWRIELSTVLQKHKSLLLALREAEIALRLAPDRPSLQLMVRDLQSKLDTQTQKPDSGAKKHGQ